MKRWVTLPLMELTVMVLVFALCAAVCLLLFARADAISRAADTQDRAVMLAQTVAEELKSHKNPPTFLVETDPASGLLVTVIPSQTLPGLNGATVQITHPDESMPLFSLEVYWQEVAP